jgi:ATP-dependent DNA helicase PIF1
MSLDFVELDIGSDIFGCGQSYVALSRVKSLEGLFISSFDHTKIKVNRIVCEFYDKLNIISEE